jgi:hypothetical protein
MHGSLIVGIQLDLCGHTLFSDKHTNAHAESPLQLLLGGNLFDYDSWFCCGMHGMKKDPRVIAFRFWQRTNL